MRLMVRAATGLLLGTCLIAPSYAATAKRPAHQQSTENLRRPIALAEGWRFRFGDAPADVVDTTFDDSGWDRVSVPHSWNRIGEYALKRGPASNNAQGIGWYRLTYDAPPKQSATRQYLDFAAVSKLADVWVNGRKVGTHKGAFARFRLDVTDAWKAGQPNVIVVRADNSKPTADNATGDVIPLSGDFFVHGGMYRPVTLLQLPEASIDPLDHGGPGVYAHAITISDAKALVDVRTKLRNQGVARKFELTTRIVDASNREVARSVQPFTLAAGATELSTQLSVTRPHRWNGRADPYLYSVSATLSEQGRVLDEVKQPLGLRSFRFDADKGFFLNGQHLKLRGVSRHQDMLNAGWALSAEQHKRDMQLIEELGANTVRQAHYQHDDAWTDAADTAGMAVWAELPYVTTPSLAGGKGSDTLWANAEEQLREQIRQNYNHPSIVMWSVGNEVDSAKGFGVKGDPPKPLALLQRLNAVAKEEDPDRPTTFADCCEGLGMIKTAGEKLAGTADLIGYNRYYGWYYPKPLEVRAQLGQTLDKLHADHPGLPISLSEYGAGAAITQHSDDVRNGYVNFVGRPHPEEYGAWVHEQSWPAIKSRDFVFASWVWAMFDFASDLRDEGDAVDLNDKGLVTADRKVKKDAFWFYKVAWSDTPAIYLAGKRYIDRSYMVMDVKAYSTAPRASLTINGRAIGQAACVDFVCEWKRVPLATGPNQASVTTVGQARRVSDTATWNGPDLRKGVRIDVGSLATRDLAGQHFGSDSFATGGSPMILNLVGFGGRSLAPPRSVQASKPELFEYWREGDSFSYAIPIPDGPWTVTLRMFEPRARVSDAIATMVSANGKPVIQGLNVQKEAGGSLKELVRSFPVTVTDGILKLDFVTSSGKASLAAIQIAR